MAVILIICGDPGGAAAVAPVLKSIRDRGRHLVHAFAYREARQIWSRAELSFEALDDAFTTQEAATVLADRQVELLLTGTSGAGNEGRLECKFTRAARELAVPSLALLDFWSDYRFRFADAEGSLAFLPDRIAVMDKQARDEMIEQGFDPRSLVITGQPAFDILGRCRDEFSDERKEQIRHELGVRPGERFLLFLSQPLGELFASDPANPRYLGYTEEDVHRALISALKEIAAKRRQPILLVIRPHPREIMRLDELDQSADFLRILLSSRGDGREVALSADLVAGMFTVLLMEAALMGCRAVSLQPGLRIPDPLPTNRSGLTPAIYGHSEIEPALDQLLFADSTPVAGAPKPPYWLGATQRVIDVAEALLGTDVKGSGRRNAGD